eukprot:349593-Chlamydomonas_euryale.AAC.9
MGRFHASASPHLRALHHVPARAANKTSSFALAKDTDEASDLSRDPPACPLTLDPPACLLTQPVP